MDRKFINPTSSYFDEKRSLFEHLIITLLALSLLVDTLNGVFVLKLGLPSLVSTAYKLGVFLLVALFTFKYEKRALFSILLLIKVCILWALGRFLLVDDMDGLFSLQEAFKAMFFPLIVLAVTTFCYVKKDTLATVVFILLFTLVLNIISSYAGVGYFSYGKFGAKGFLYGGNAASSIVILCASYLFVTSIRQSVSRFFLWFGVMLLIALLMGTKSGILGVFVAAGIAFIINLNARKLLLLIVLLLGAFLALFQFYEDIITSRIVDRVIFFYETGGIQRAILSGREDKFAVIMPLFFSDSLQFQVFGVDRSVLLQLAYQRIELDIFDMLVFFGLPFTFMIYAFYLFFFMKLWKRATNPAALSVLVGFFCLALVSNIAGHVVFNGIVTPVMGLFVGLALMNTPCAEGETSYAS